MKLLGFYIMLQSASIALYPYSRYYERCFGLPWPSSESRQILYSIHSVTDTFLPHLEYSMCAWSVGKPLVAFSLLQRILLVRLPCQSRYTVLQPTCTFPATDPQVQVTDTRRSANGGRGPVALPRLASLSHMSASGKLAWLEPGVWEIKKGCKSTLFAPWWCVSISMFCVGNCDSRECGSESEWS